MNANIHELTQLMFINAASLPFAKVDIDGNTLFAGRNGAGKTTILRAVLYFYGAFRSEALGISRKKQRFEEYYFGPSNAYLVYTFTNAYGTVLAVVYKSGGVRLKYRFAKVPSDFDLSTIERLFFEGHKAREPKELFHALLTAHFELSPVLHTAKEYQNVLYGQDRALITYSFFPANASYDQIAKTISNIFVNSKLDSGSIKRSLASSVTGFEPIDLAQIEQKIDAFSVQHDDIKAFEKNLPFIHDAIDKLKTLETQKETITTQLLQLRSNAAFASKKAATLQAELIALETAHEAALAEHNGAQTLYQEEKIKRGEEIAILENKLGETDEKYKEYEAQDVASKLKAYESRPQIEERLDGLRSQRGLLTREFEDTTKRFDALKAQVDHTYAKLSQQLLSRENTLKTAHFEALSQAEKKRDKALETLEQTRQETPYAEALEAAREAKAACTQELKSAQEKTFLTHEIQEAHALYAHAKEAFSALEQIYRIDKKELEIIFGKKAALETQTANEKALLRERYLQAKTAQSKALETVAHKLSHLSTSVAQFLDESGLPHKQTLLNILRDEVLFASHLSPRITEGDSLLGLELAWEAIGSAPVTLHTLQEEHAKMAKALETLKQEYETQDAALDAALKTQLKALIKNELDLRAAIEKNDIELSKLERAKLTTQEALLELQARQNEAKTQAVEALQSKLQKCEADFRAAHEALSGYKKEIALAQASIKAAFETERNALEVTLNDALVLLNAELSEAKAAHEAECAKLDATAREALASQGVDEKLLGQLERDIADLEAKRKEAQSYEGLIARYRVDGERLFDRRAEHEARLQTLRAAQNEKAARFHALLEAFESQTAAYKKARKQIIETQGRIARDLEAFERFEKSADYAAFAKFSEIQEIAPDTQSLDTLVFALQENISGQKDTLRALHKKLNAVFDTLSAQSSFNLERPKNDDDISLIIAAKALQTFIEEDKLGAFKSEVAQLYRGTLHYIASETTELLKADMEIKKVVGHINATLRDLQGIKVIENVELRFKESDDALLNALKTIVELSEHISPFGADTLFGHGNESAHHKNMLKALEVLSRELHGDKRELLSVDDSFVLEFRAVENGHDTGFVPSLDGIGSNGTDVMVKAMVYIAMLSLARKQSSKNEHNVYFHCILDEVGILAPNYLKELIDYANNKQIRFINGAPDEKLVTTYKRLYMLSTNAKHQTVVRRLLAQA